ncbi:MAG: [protein-PII] uridylyltransferase [Gammaproteobacteria bacterium]|nr:[protein-PII] uridylyltransferase [Gammaproteobacteria bacterium]
MHAFNKPTVDDVNNLFDEQKLNDSLQQGAGNIVSALKDEVAAINQGLKTLYQNGAPVEDIVFGRASLMDRLLTTLYQHIFSDIKQPVALIAVGGFGRGELHPASDIDLMLLLQDKEDTITKDAIEQFIMLLWDGGLEIGHSVRTLDECAAEAASDITIATNIMEARLLAGDLFLFDSMQQLTGPDSIWGDQAFFQTKLKEQVQRNGKYNDTAYNLEPNIKEGHGGLRDIQMIGWVTKRHFGASSLRDLVDHRFLREEELTALLEGQRLLWQIRCSLHYLTGRREDRLLFDYQHQLALEFGFEDDAEKRSNRAIEQFMQQYYRTVMELERLNEMLLQLFREAILYKDKPGEIVVINESFQTIHGYIEVRHENVFSDKPSALLELFLINEQHPEIQGVRAETIRLIRKNRHLIDDEFRESDEAKRLFIEIIRQSRGVTHEFRRMNRYGILAAYIPAFGRIVGRMQYDLFHAFTVDQHTLFVLRNLRRLSVPNFCHEFPLASGISHHLKKPELLYLAGLFHDIAKGRDGDHSELGAEDALEFCLSHGLSQKDSRLVSWLVRNHLIMSITAQRKDISDPEVIADFAEKVNSLRNLDYLYLLTMSDIRATNPKQWNSWKDKLLIELYNKTAHMLQQGVGYQANRQRDIEHNRTYAFRNLAKEGFGILEIDAIWDNFTDEYFLRHTPAEIVWHTKEIKKHTDTNTPVVKTRTDSRRGSMELFVFSRSVSHMFARIVSVLGQLNLSVADAFIMRGMKGCLLETYKIVFSDDMVEHIDNYANEVVPLVVDKLADTELSDLTTMAVPRVQKHFEVETKISFTQIDDNGVTRMHIETRDRPGLLSIIARTFIQCNIGIHSAKISTAGETANDYFDITQANRLNRLSDDMKYQLKQALLEQL